MDLYPTGLPVLYDLTDPSSNLAAYDGIMPSYLADNRFLWGAELVPAFFAGAYGYRRNGALGGLLWALAGYMAPLPVAGVIAYEAGTRSRVF